MDKEEIINKLLNGEMRLYQIDKFTENATEALDIRREFIEKYCDCELEQIANYTLDMEIAMAKNIENPIGTVQFPIGVAGPLKVNGEYADGEFFGSSSTGFCSSGFFSSFTGSSVFWASFGFSPS